MSRDKTFVVADNVEDMYLQSGESLYAGDGVHLGWIQEETCYVLDYSVTPDEGSILCRLSCDHEVLTPDLGPFNPSIEYCPYCGAKVVQNVH